MESSNLHLMPLKTLANQVESFASLCLPDFIYTQNETRDLAFIETDLREYVGGIRPDVVAAISMTEEKPQRYAFTKWSRSQLLSHLGTREKWFATVTRAQEVDELNKRAHALQNYKFRTMKGYDSVDLHLIRGIVSRQYADIPDTYIMEALTKIMPEGSALRGYSGKTDRAFYAYAVTGEKISIPNTRFEGYAGVVLRNSEVGFTSLTVTPMVFLPRYRRGAIVVLKKKTALRRIHRGPVSDLIEKFTEALDKIKVIWAPMDEKLRGLAQIMYASEDDAIETMSNLLESVGGDRLFAMNVAKTYRAAAHTTHHALNVFDAILENVAGDDQDDSYVNAELAGAVLLHFIQ